MHQLPLCGFASSTTSGRVAEHNQAVAALEADEADVERLAVELANLDAMIVSPDEAETKAREVGHRRYVNLKVAVGLLQSRLPLVEALQRDRRQAEEEASEGWQQRRKEVTEALGAVGYAHLLSDPNPVVRARMADIIGAAAPVVNAANRYGSLREQLTVLSGLAIMTRQEIGRLTEKLRATVREAAAAVV